jgi:hypothetical protein
MKRIAKKSQKEQAQLLKMLEPSLKPEKLGSDSAAGVLVDNSVAIESTIHHPKNLKRQRVAGFRRSIAKNIVGKKSPTPQIDCSSKPPASESDV